MAAGQRLVGWTGRPRYHVFPEAMRPDRLELLLIPSLVDNDAIEIAQAIRRANGRGAGKPRVLRDIHASTAAAPPLRRTGRQGFPTPTPIRPRDLFGTLSARLGMTK